MNGFDIFSLISFPVLIMLISGRVVFLKRKGIKVSSDSENKNRLGVFIYSAFLLIFLIWLFELIKPVFRISFSVLPEVLAKPLIDSNLMTITGVFVTLFALVLLTFTLLHFRKSLRFGLNEKNCGELITTGVFAFSRNPFFLSLDLYFAGIAFLQPNLFFIGFAVLELISIHFYILKEEKFLLKNYGNSYSEYQRKVRRYMGKY